jgi:two-component system, NtrC family, response regulator AtoC
MASAPILIIDANPDTRDTLARVVREAGHRVLATGRSSEGLALVSSMRPVAVVLDLDNADTDALNLIRQIRLESTDPTLVALAETPETGLVVAAMRAGASDVLGKPARPEAVLGALRAGLEPQDDARAAEVPRAPGSDGDRFWPDLDLLFHNSQRMRAVENIVRRAADTNATILLEGESGTGKEMVAKAIHHISDRGDRPFLKVNCASLPGELLESELFGHEKGAFTGAHRRKPGKFELAHRGTFLLDEIGEMPLGLQAKLLHVLQDGKFFRVGGSDLIETDVRLIAATNKDLASVMAAGAFREDLYYRLAVVTIYVPPLRERPEEIPHLVSHFLAKFCLQYDREPPSISPETMQFLRQYSWPGNVRELENMIKRLVVLQNEALIQEEIALRQRRPLPPTVAARSGGTGTPGPWAGFQPQAPHSSGSSPPSAPGPTAAPVEAGLGLKEIAKRAAMEAEKIALKEVLDRVRWNRAEAARLLKISYKALLYKITAAGLDGKGDRGKRK